MIVNGAGISNEAESDGIPANLGRAVLLRFDAGHPLTALAPAWAGLCGLLASGGMQLDQRTLVLSALVLLLVEPLLGGLWHLLVPAHGANAAAGNGVTLPNVPVEPLLTEPTALPANPVVVLPFGRPESPASRLLSALAVSARSLGTAGWPAVSTLLGLCFALAVASLLGPAPAFVALAVVLIIMRRLWQTGHPARILQALYDLALPWLIGLAALGMVAEHGTAPYREVFALVALYTIAYAACLALADGIRLPALLALDAAQLAVLGLLLARQETLAVWLFGLCLIGQLTAHPGLLGGGSAHSFLRRASPYIVAGMIAAAIALTPALA